MPIAEYINHEIIELHYDFLYNEGNPSKCLESKFEDPLDLKDEELE